MSAERFLGAPVKGVKKHPEKKGWNKVTIEDPEGREQTVDMKDQFVSQNVERGVSMTVPIDVSKLPKKRKRGKAK